MVTKNIGVYGNKDYLWMNDHPVLWRPTEIGGCELLLGNVVSVEDLPPAPPVTGPILIPCSACEQDKPLDEFDRDKRRPARHYRFPICKACRKQMRVSDRWYRG